MNRFKTARSSFFVIFFTFVLFFVLGVNEVKAVDTDAVTTEITDFKASDYDKEKAYLFVQDGSESSEAILDYISQMAPENTEIFHLYIVNVPKGGEIYNEYVELYKSKCEIDDIFVPAYLYKDVCTLGVEEIALDIGARFGLETENVTLKQNLKEANDYLQSEIEKYNREVASMTLLDYIKEIKPSTLIVTIIAIILIIVSIVVILFFRNNIDPRKRKIVITAQTFLLISSLGFLTFKVNNVRTSLAPLKSEASGCHIQNNCATYEDLMNSRAESGNEEEQRVAKKYEEQKKKDEILFGSNAAHLNTTPPAEQTLYTDLLKSVKEGGTVEVNGVTYTYKGGTLYNGGAAISVANAFKDVKNSSDVKITNPGGTSTTPINQNSIDQYVANSGSAGAEEIKEKKMAEVIQFAEKGKKCFVNGKEVDCNKNVLCQMPTGTSACVTTDVLYYCIIEGKPVDCNKNAYCQMPTGTSVCEKYASGDYAYRYDIKTQTPVLVPTGKSNVDPCVEGTPGNNITASLLCNCGTYWTSAVTGTCDQICRVEKLICDTCNYPTSEPPVIPPTTPGVPYCGDGILGNTTGEKCEYGDPTGVSCSWNVCNNKTCTCPTVPTPFCGDGKINAAGEQCEVGDPSGTTCKWDTCNHTTCKCVTPGCGDGKLDTGEQCEKGDPSGTSCKWDTCNQLKCECIKPGCGDGTLDTGEKCEKGDPTGVSCLWDECDKSNCECEVEVSESCGDGNLDAGEQCEEGNPSGASCTWDKCSKSTCLCPIAPVETYPQTSIFESSYMRNIIIGGTLLILGILLYPMAQFIDDMYITIGGKAIKIGRYVTKHDEVSRNKKKKKIEDNFK